MLDDNAVKEQLAELIADRPRDAEAILGRAVALTENGLWAAREMLKVLRDQAGLAPELQEFWRAVLLVLDTEATRRCLGAELEVRELEALASLTKLATLSQSRWPMWKRSSAPCAARRGNWKWRCSRRAFASHWT